VACEVRAFNTEGRSQGLQVVDQIVQAEGGVWCGTFTVTAKIVTDAGEAVL
jgi:hypothetical protein